MLEGHKSIDQKAAEAEITRFHDARGPFVVAVETTRAAMIFTDPTFDGNPIIFANQAYLEMTGFSSEEVLGQSFDDLNEQTADAVTIQTIKQAFASVDGGATDVRYLRKDDSVFWASLMISPVRNDVGKIVQHFCSLIDINKHMAQEAESRRLIQELNHRVKNTLATVQSIVSQALHSAEDRTTLEKTIEARLSALSRSHDLLSRENWTGANLRDVIDEALGPFLGVAAEPARISISGPDVRLSPKTALALGIGFNELATNAVKYGALSNQAGAVHVDWTINKSKGGRRLYLRWEERGGPEVKAALRKGFGTRMIEQGLKHELGGSSAIEFLPMGVVCTLYFVLDA